MSTFGKKAIDNWEYQYSEEKFQRFNRTPIEIQLEILERWYPIGMPCFKYDKFFKKYGNTLYEVIGYNSIGAGTIAQLELRKHLVIGEKVFKENVTIHPMVFKPSDEWIKQMDRDKKLNDLLG